MKCRGYLDIETTGLSAGYNDLTVIGLLLDNGSESRFIQLVGSEISKPALRDSIREVDVLYTYNGSRFDLPFIESKLALNLTKYCEHKDLMYDCWQRNIYGGLKWVEQELGIKRKLTGVDGYMAVELWYRYERDGDEQALKTLLDYNREDVLNLKVLREKLAA
jgi:uncharacterized protein